MTTGKNRLSDAVRVLIETDPKRAADFVEGMEPERAGRVICALSHSVAADFCGRLDPAFMASMLERMSPLKAAPLLEGMESQAAADAFYAIGGEARARLLEALTPDRKKILQELLTYPADSAGRMMTTDLLTFRKGAKVREVITRLRAAARKKPLSTYVYVLDEEKKLIGVLNMRDVLLAAPDAPVETAMQTGVLAVTGFTDREELVRLAMDKRYIAVPVVDAEHRLLGAVRLAELVGSGQEEASEDMQILFGASPDERPFSPVSFKVRHRLPWLYVNLATAFLAGSVVALFEDVITKVSVLAVFLPIIAGQGGNAGTQTLAVILRGLIMREIRPDDAWRAVLRETGVGAINGLTVGAVTSVIAWFWKGNPWLGLVVGLAMAVNLVAAGAAGAAIPLVMKRLGFDPAQSSGIVLTTVTDVVGFFAFLGFATLFLPYLTG